MPAIARLRQSIRGEAPPTTFALDPGRGSRTTGSDVWFRLEWALASSRMSAYHACFPPRISDTARIMIESSVEPTGPAMHSKVDLVFDAPSGVLEWIRRKARLADDSPLGLRMADAATVRCLVGE